MHGSNQSGVSEFLLLGISESPEQQRILFWMFLSMYLVTVVGNVLIILAISFDPRLHTPMYFFLANLSFTDLFFVTNTIPKMLVSLQSQNKLTHTLLMTRVTFCGSRKIHYIFCEMYVLLRLACSNTQVNHTVLIATGSFIFLAPLGFMIMSYVCIVRAILRIPSASSKYKAFSTCASHLAVVSLFYGTLCMVYLQPLQSYSMKDSVATVMYAVVTPMMNPFIYSLRNKDMHGALGRLLLGKAFQRLT
ncbi:olfactory receptor 1D2-like [Puma concolor]|uniref:Olfactory receptor 1D2-like n=1 Tax=Puma concolor TaxID=9696 RepID=A0A6P6HEN7_PUMCO|nr:olfactory receptor 1D2-like [Puma concolor]